MELTKGYISEKDLRAMMDKYIKMYNWMLFARCSTENSGVTEERDTYAYSFIDDLNINILIDPVSKSFEFTKIVDNAFKLESGEFSPIDYPDHFERFYMKFRKIVIEKEL